VNSVTAAYQTAAPLISANATTGPAPERDDTCWTCISGWDPLSTSNDLATKYGDFTSEQKSMREKVIPIRACQVASDAAS
jgi:hypothetical protein